MWVIETNYDEIDYDKLRSKKMKVSDNIGKLAKVLVPYCDSQTLSELGCNDCPFYENDWKSKDLSMCMIINMGYGQPCYWAVYEEDELK